MAASFTGGLCTGAAIDAALYFACGQLAPEAAYAPLALMSMYRAIVALGPLRHAGKKAKEAGAGNDLTYRTRQATLFGVCVSPVFVIASLRRAWKGVRLGCELSKPVLKRILRVR